MDAVKRGYLKELVLAITEEPDSQDNVLERYTVSCEYAALPNERGGGDAPESWRNRDDADPGVQMTLAAERGDGKVCTKTEVRGTP